MTLIEIKDYIIFMSVTLGLDSGLIKQSLLVRGVNYDDMNSAFEMAKDCIYESLI